jgi:hypothetical protein
MAMFHELFEGALVTSHELFEGALVHELFEGALDVS